MEVATSADGGRDVTGDEENNQINNNEGTKYCREDSNCDSAFQWCDKTIFKVYGTCGYTQAFYIGLAVTIVLILIIVATVIFFLWRKSRQYFRSNTEEDQAEKSVTEGVEGSNIQMREKEKPRGVLYSSNKKL